MNLITVKESSFKGAQAKKIKITARGEAAIFMQSTSANVSQNIITSLAQWCNQELISEGQDKEIC